MAMNPAGTKVVKGTSKRTGAVMWVRADVTPSDYRSEAGLFTDETAAAAIAEYTASLTKVVGRCAWNFEVLEAAATKGIK